MLLVLGCEKKRYPENFIENEAVFSFKAVLGGESVELKAGHDNYYMYSSYSQNSEGLYSFNGKLQRTDCADCGETFELSLNNSQLSAASAPVLADSAFAADYREFAISDASETTVKFNGLYNKSAISYNWDFGDGSQSNIAQPQHTYTKAGRYNVCLTVTGSNGCTGTSCNVIDFSRDALRTEISAQSIDASTILFSQKTTGKAPFTYDWSFGDGSRSTEPSPMHQFGIAGSYAVTLRVTDSEGRTVTSKYNAATGNDVSSCTTNYTIDSPVYLPANQLSACTIAWRDKSGATLTSALAEQPADSYFEITGSEPYTLNEKGEPTRKLKIRFSCVVSDGTKTVKIENAETVIAVSYK